MPILPQQKNEKVTSLPSNRPRVASRRKPSNAPVVRVEEVATKERQQQLGGLVKDFFPESPNSRVLVMRQKAAVECKLDYYRLCGVIDGAEYDAGMRVRDAWLTLAEGIKTRDSTSCGVSASGKIFDPLLEKTWAEKTMAAVYKDADLTAAQLMAVIKVCGSDEVISADSHIRTLRRALERLARFWKII